jgi:hypothetical protein
MNIAVVVVALLMGLMGVAALVRPPVIWAPFGIEPTTPGARSEVRAVYGGFGLAIAAVLVWAELYAAVGVRDGVLLTVAASLFGMAAGRVVSALVEPKALLGWPGFFLVVEAVGGLITCLAR